MIEHPIAKGKIKTVDELAKILGPRPREKKVIMCHGNFDIVHPGHVRHLMYAKAKADILVASLTCDAFITKGNFRPFVPEDVRAVNLAALEIVDYVVIDRNSKPLENIKKLQPDYFAKGYEYFKDGLPPKTEEERQALSEYGGEILFTPGDIVYSSTAIINAHPPDLSNEKLSALLAGESLTFKDLNESMEDFPDRTIHIIGDTIVDSYSYCSVIGSGSKTPTLSVKEHETVDFVGGAAVVAKHIRKAGARVIFTTVLGEDHLKDFVIDDLKEAGVEVNAFIDSSRPTTRKQAFIANGYRLLKVDKLDNRSIADSLLEKFIHAIQTTKADGVVFSDFRHGIFSKSTIPALIEAIPQGVFRVADSQVASRWGNILDFKGFDLITPNEREARFALADQDSVVRPLGRELYQMAQCKNMILKLGERGTITYRPCKDETHDPRFFFSVDSFAGNVVDPVGAGDALLAYATLAMISTKNPVIASIVGSIAAGIACENDGNVPVSPSDVAKKLDRAQGDIDYRTDIPREGASSGQSVASVGRESVSRV